MQVRTESPHALACEHGTRRRESQEQSDIHDGSHVTQTSVGNSLACWSDVPCADDNGVNPTGLLPRRPALEVLVIGKMISDRVIGKMIPPTAVSLPRWAGRRDKGVRSIY
jgi:hypothetical protein